MFLPKNISLVLMFHEKHLNLIASQCYKLSNLKHAFPKSSEPLSSQRTNFPEFLTSAPFDGIFHVLCQYIFYCCIFSIFKKMSICKVSKYTELSIHNNQSKVKVILSAWKKVLQCFLKQLWNDYTRCLRSKYK